MLRSLSFVSVLFLLLCSGYVLYSSPVADNTGISVGKNIEQITEPSNLEPFQADGIISPNEYQYLIPEDNGLMKIYWRDDGDSISCGLVGQVTGWLAIGFDPTIMMKDADIVLGYVKDGKAVVSDQYSTGPTGPHSDDTVLGGTDDLMASGGKEENGTTVIEFSRLKETGDTYDAVLASNGPGKIIWALANTDVPDMAHNIARGSDEIRI